MSNSSVPVTLDVSVLEGLREIDASLVGQVIVAYIESSPSDMQKIEKAVLDRDAQALSSSAHGLKSASASVGAMAVSHYCLQLEKMGREGSVVEEVCTQLLKALQESYSSALTELKKHK
jgi:HPt (histidine-containing phosphotransfer) domain-containing protein